MRLHALKIKNFKCISDTGWLRIADVSMLVGENDSGKTSALEALSYLLGSGRPSVDDITLSKFDITNSGLPHEDELEIRGLFQLTDDERSTLSSPQLQMKDYLHVILRLTQDGALSWHLLGSVPDDETLRIDLDSATTTRSVLFGILNSHGIIIPGNTAKAALVASVRSLQLSAGRIEEEITVQHPPHADAFRLLDFRDARNPQSVIDATLRDRFRTLITEDEGATLSEVSKRSARALKKELATLRKFVAIYRPDIIDLDIDINPDFARGFTGAPVGRQYSIRGSGGPPPARWAVACTLQRGLHRPPRSNQAQRGSG